jgi:hypothetical protein
VDVTVTGPGGTSATSSNDQFAYLSGSAPAYSEATGFPIDLSGSGQTTVALTPQSVGDVVTLFVKMHSGATPTVSSLSAPNIAWQGTPTVVNNDPSVPIHVELWYGVATSTSTGTTTINYSGSVTGNNIELVADSFHSSLAGTWGVIAQGSANGSSATVQYPSLTSAFTGGVYVGYSRVASSVTSGSTPGFGYYITPNADAELRNLSLAGSTAYAPTATQAAASEYTSTAAILYLAPSG